MKITEYIPFIKEQFQFIKDSYNMSWHTNSNEYIIFLENQHIKVRFATLHREDGINITINNMNNHFYTMLDLKKAKGNNKTLSFLDNTEKNRAKKYEGSLKYIIYIYSRFIENHCQDILSGDFSQVGSGNPNQ